MSHEPQNAGNDTSITPSVGFCVAVDYTAAHGGDTNAGPCADCISVTTFHTVHTFLTKHPGRVDDPTALASMGIDPEVYAKVARYFKAQRAR